MEFWPQLCWNSFAVIRLWRDSEAYFSVYWSEIWVLQDRSTYYEIPPLWSLTEAIAGFVARSNTIQVSDLILNCLRTSEFYSRHYGNLVIGECLQRQRARYTPHLVWKLLNFAKLLLGPAVDRVFRTGFTLSVILGDPNAAEYLMISRWYSQLKRMRTLALMPQANGGA